MKTKVLTALIALFSFSFVTQVMAEPSCTEWSQQNDGSYWRTCVGDDGRQYCESSYNDYITRVKCQ